MNHYRAVILVLASNNNQHYNNCRKIWKTYMMLDKTIRVFFIYGKLFDVLENYDKTSDIILDNIPEINTFTLDLITIDSATKIILSTCVLIGIIGICSYYIYKSRFPKINGILFLVYITSIIVSFYLFYHNGGTIYFHHYFIGLLVMIISRNYHSNIVVVIHAFAYGVYIDGISRWGYASIYH